MSQLKDNSVKTITTDQNAIKKALVLGNAGKGRVPFYFKIIITLSICIVGGLGAYYLVNSPVKKTLPLSAQATPESASGAVVTHDVKTFEDGKARHFQYMAGDIAIKYFILKSSDNVIRAAFDACDVCWPAGKGYYQQGDVMVCRNCGRRFASLRINEVSGGCNPAPLVREINGDKVIIQVKEILSGKKYFTFA